MQGSLIGYILEIACTVTAGRHGLCTVSNIHERPTEFTLCGPFLCGESTRGNAYAVEGLWVRFPCSPPIRG